MAVPRIPEAEVMDSVQDAEEYQAMDFAQVNRQFVLDLAEQLPLAGTWLDLGTGPAELPILACEQFPAIEIVAVDAAAAMLDVAEKRITTLGLQSRIHLALGDAKSLPYADQVFSVIFSNSLVHHLPDPRLFFQELKRLVTPGGLVFVRDLVRPATLDQLTYLVEQYTVNDTEYQRKLFADSLWAAFTIVEIASLASWAGMSEAQVTLSSDRHWTLVWRAIP